MIKKVKRKKEEVFFQIFFSLLILILIGFLLFSNLKIVQRRAQLEEKIENLRKEIQTLEEKKEKLEAGISESQKESYLEERAREQGFVKKGEKPVVILPPKENEKKENFLNPKNWLEWLKIKLRD